MQVSLILASAFSAVEARWTVGLGLEHQLNQLISLLGTGTDNAAEMVPTREHNLDYTALVRPEVVAATLTEEVGACALSFMHDNLPLIIL